MNRQMNKRSVVATLIVCLVCLVIVTGSTFSLFTSESNVNIAVTSGEVKLTAAIAPDSLKIYSKGVQTSGFVNGGSATLTETGLELMNITPGDKATFDIKLVNKSTIDIQYRVTWTVTTKNGEVDLANALVATAGDQLISTLNPSWTTWAAEDADNQTIVVAVELPLTAGNECQGEELTINFHVEAVQGNHADPVHVNSAANLQDAIDAGATEIILDGNIDLSESITIGNLSSSSVYSRRKAKASVPADAMHINLNGYTITYDGTGAAIVNNSNVAITGGDISAPSGVAIQNNAVAVVESVDIAGAVSSSGALTLNESSITVSGDVAAISTSGTGSVVINSGSYSNKKEDGTVGTVISGNVTVNDGNFDGKVEANGSVAPTISGGNFTDKPADEFIQNDAPVYYDVDGVTYYTLTVDGNTTIGLYLVPAEYKGDTVVVAKGTTVIGNYAFAYNSNVKTVILADSVRSLGRGFDSSTVEKVVLNEGLEQIDSRAFRSTTALKEVVFSSTVTVIEDSAFQKSGIKEIVIPASVTTIGEIAFGASLIEKVTFEGNTDIEGYAFRGCTKLNTVILNGFDVNFVASRLNGRNSCWFCNGESNNPNTSNITFYVKTNVIKDRVLTAMGAEKNNTPVIVEMSSENGYDVDANGVAYVYTAEALKAAIADKKDIVLCSDITLAASNGGYNKAGIVINGQILDGNGHTLKVTGANGTWDCAIYTNGGTIKNIVVAGAMRGIFTAGSSADIYLENVSFNTIYTFNSDDGNGQYGVYATDCTFNGWTSFSNCHKEVVFTDCTFTEGSGYAFCRPYNATKFVDCTFTEGYKLDTSCVSGLVFDNCKYSDGLFYNGYNGAIFNGSVCVCTADELIAAINAAEDGATIYLTAGDYALRFTNNTSFNVNNLTIKGMGDVNLAISSSEAWYGRVQGSNVIFENIHFTSAVGATGKATYNNCTFDSWAICASSNKEETYYNNCTINGCLNTSTDFSSGDIYVKGCKIAMAEYSGSMTVNFENCEIGEVIIWNSNTNFTNCEITTLNDDNVTSATVTIK